MKAIALLGGPKSEWPTNLQAHLRQKRADYFLIGVDRGALHLIEMGLVPDICVGDFDSLTEQELSLLESKCAEIRYSTPIKDLTDSELMLQTALIDYQVDSLRIYGATGGRLDHMLVNLFTFLKPEFRQYAEQVELVDRNNTVQYLLPGSHEIADRGSKYFGVAVLSSADKLSITGAKYELAPTDVLVPTVYGSNEFLAQASCQIAFETGLVAIIYSAD